MSEASLSFYLKRSLVYLQYLAQDGRIQISTGLKVDDVKFKANKLTKDEKAVLSRLQNAIDTYEAECRLLGNMTTKHDISKIVLDATGRKPKERPKSSNSFYNLYTKYIKEVEAGLILNDGKKYSQSFIKSANVVTGRLEKAALGNISPEKITENDMKYFVAELTASGLAKNSVASYLDPVLSVYNGSRRIGWHKGAILDTRAFRAKREDIDHAVYLTNEDQAKILAYKYSGQDALWRDAFILGCRLGMRHSDLYRLTPQHRQGDLVNINTTKTTTAVWVPLDAIAKELWDKHGGVFKIPQLTPFMDFAKKLGADAELTKQVLFSRTEGGKKVERWMKKHELLGTHSMRRSFATNAYKANVPVPSIMKITGHKSLANFLKYIRLSDEEHGTLLLQHTHFK